MEYRVDSEILTEISGASRQRKVLCWLGLGKVSHMELLVFPPSSGASPRVCRGQKAWRTGEIS